MEIMIKVRKKIAYSDQTVIVCGNDDYTVAFDWDAEWDELNPMMVVVCQDGTAYPPIAIENKCAKLPKLCTQSCAIGLVSGEIRTSTAAVFRCLPSIQDGASAMVEISQDLYDILLERLQIKSTEKFKGADGITPTIGANGNWYLGDTDTGKPSQGVAGKDGAKGEKGDPGEQGPQGEKGETGAKGDAGATGPTGPTGPQGEKGADGAKGDTGPQGPKGETGETGPKGDKGDTGEAGPRGATGAPGADGKTPVRGTDYWTEADKAEINGDSQSFIVSELAKREQLGPLFANSVEECTDTGKLYVLPDGFIYAYMRTEIVGVSYANLVPISTDTDGSIYNGTGYKDGVRLSSSGSVSSSTQAGSVTTGFMPSAGLKTIRIKGATFAAESGKHYYVVAYDANKTLLYALSANENENYSRLTMNARDDGVLEMALPDPVDSTWYKALAESAYIRITAKGSGADLIVTINEDIGAAGSAVTYQWKNTGHAFVPADYEERIASAEKEAAEAAKAVAALKQRVDDIADGTAGITASEKFDPTGFSLPILYLIGDISPIKDSKSNTVTLEYVYGDRTGTCTLKGQGASSYQNAQALIAAGKAGKFNYTIKFDTAFEAADGWGEHTKYCLKANYIDCTHSRNVVSAKLWGLMVKSRSTVPAELSTLPNGGAVDGFPVIVMVNGAFHGLYTWNIPKDEWMFGMAADVSKTQAFVSANNHSDATQFKGELIGDGSDLELEFVSDETNTEWVTTSLNTLINACASSDGTDLDTTLVQYIDWDSAIDYLIFITVVKGTDMVDKNFLLTTFDGTKWFFTAYDIDSVYGLEWDGSTLTRAVSNVSFSENAAASKMWELIYRFKTNALKSRYRTLRSNILSETRICQLFENFAWAIPLPVLLEDVKLYPTILGSSVNGIDQICRWVRQRLETVDAWVEALPAQEQ